MKIHEYQAKQLLREAGVAVPAGIVATTADEAAAAFKQLGGPLAVVKAQIHAGGRGKGTIKDNPQAARRAARPKPPTRPRSRRQPARQEAGHDPNRPRRPNGPPRARRSGCDIARELYLGIVVDRAAACRC